MASTDSELIDEVRALTDYTQGVYSDSEMQALVNLCKEELRADFDEPNFQFYQTGDDSTLAADRALFWFVCIAAKIRAGEIGGISIDVAEVTATQPSSSGYEVWFKNFEKRLNEAQKSVIESGPGPAHTTEARDDRTYGDSFDTSVRRPE